MQEEFCGELIHHDSHRFGDNLRCPGWGDEPARRTQLCYRVEAHGAHNWGVGDNDEGQEELRYCPGYPSTRPNAGNLRDEDDFVHTQRFEPTEEQKAYFKAVHDQMRAGREVTRWADEAMFKAAPIDASKGPKVYLLWMTPDPLGAIAAACKMYKGEVVRSLGEVSDAERLEYFQQVQKTKLKAPFEFVKFHFMIEGVTRAFTHQMVRQRTAAYAQESLRFAVKEDMPVALPPSLQGLPDDDPKIQQWFQATSEIQSAYDSLVGTGVPAEDARGLLPHNVLTRLHYTTDLRALLDHAGNRLCTQAQFEWRLVFSRIIEVIRGVSWDAYAGYLNGIDCVYMADKLLDAFKPVCFQTGKCEFKANFDRHCNIRERVDANERAGRPSSEWDKDLLCHPDGCDHPEIEIQSIKPGEWLLDPGAARKKG